MDGKLADTLVLAGDAEGLGLDLLADIVEVGVAFVNVKELAPLRKVGGMFRDGCMDELEDKRSASDDA